MVQNEEIKISFIGDIMCEKPLLKASKIGDKYNFNEVFSSVKTLFKKSDYVVGNLETICAGEELGFTNHIFSFNTPESFIEAIKNSGIDLVTTATNHCLDRGIVGLKKNLYNLNKYKLDSIGTYANPEDRDEIFIKDFNGLKIAFLNYTYGTNTHINGVVLEENEIFHVNLLQPQDLEINKLKNKQTKKDLKSFIARNLFKVISLEQWIRLKRSLGLSYYKAFQDNDLDGIDENYLKRIKNDIERAKSEADFVIVCMHSGGQFNTEPGEFSKFMMNFMSENGVDFVVANHPHIVQKHEIFPSGMFGAYSLGNFSISPSSVYVLHEDLPDYSIMLHLYFDLKNKKVKKITFSILKIVEKKDCSLQVYPVYDLIESCLSKEEKDELISNSRKIYNRFLGKESKNFKIEKEYIINFKNNLQY